MGIQSRVPSSWGVLLPYLGRHLGLHLCGGWGSALAPLHTPTFSVSR